MEVEPLKPETFGAHRALAELTRRLLAQSPRHESFLKRRFQGVASEELALCDAIAAQIGRLAGDEYGEFLKGYDFICDIQKDEEIYFRRNKAYRLKTFEDAFAQVYSNKPYMQSYMRGLLMTQVLWSNHTASMGFYLREFLGRQTAPYDLLEIGPGHGLLMARALADANAHSVTGWDLSDASLAETRTALEKLGVTRPYKLEKRNLFDAGPEAAAFDAVVFSEVLEHLEEPERALAGIRAVMRPGARLYINVPINSPAPDHLFLLRSPEEAVEFTRSCGFEIERTGFYPATNYTLEAARKHALTVSVCIVATRPAS